MQLPTTRPLAGLADPIDPSPTPEDLAIASDTRQHIACTLYRLLPCLDASVMVELYFEDQTAADVARWLGKSEDQIDYIRRKALKTLRTVPNLASLLRPTATRSIT